MDAAHDLEALAKRVEAATHMSREIDSELKAVEGSQFSRAYTGYIDEAARLVPKRFVWCCGTVYCDDTGLEYFWANVRNRDPHLDGYHNDHSVRAASPALALCAASLRALSQGVNDDATR